MYTYSPTDTFDAAQLLDTSDPVLGGASGVGQSNLPLEILANRTQYLFNRLGRFLGDRIVNASGAITPTDIFKKIKAVTNANITLTLDAVATFPVGAIIKIKAKITATSNTGKWVKILPNGSESIEDGNITNNAVYLCDGEDILLVAGDDDGNGTPDHWELSPLKWNSEMAGEDRLVRFRPRNTLLANGCQPEISGSLLLRADYERLAAKVIPVAIADAIWLSDIRYRQFWSLGNGTTTMRPPDMRSMVYKGLDLGRGLSLNRLDNVEGGLELDALLRHDHSVPSIPLLKPDVDRGTSTSSFSVDNIDNSTRTGLTGGDENLIKTVGFIPIIFY